MGFNTLPSNSVAGGASFQQSGLAANLLPPQLARSSLGGAAFENLAQSNRYEGFLGNRDYVELPVLTGNNLEYFNNSGASQFTVSKANIHANVDDWVGFMFDRTDSLIYIVAVDEGTTPNTYYTASVNSSGTVVNIGNAQPSSDFTTTATGWWINSANTTGASTIQRASDGIGNLFARQSNNASMEEMEINISTGAIVSDPAVIDVNLVDVAWRSQAGNYYSVDIATLQTFYNAFTKTIKVSINSPANFGWSSNSAVKFIQWKGRIYETQANTANLYNNRIVTTINIFDTWMDKVISTYGMG